MRQETMKGLMGCIGKILLFILLTVAGIFLLVSVDWGSIIFATRTDSIVRGELAEIEHTIGFILATDLPDNPVLEGIVTDPSELKYISASNIDLELLEEIALADAEWLLPGGFELVESSLELEPRTVQLANLVEEEIYQARGVGLKARAKFEVTRTAQLGEHAISIKLPGLVRTAHQLKAVPVFSQNTFWEVLEPDESVMLGLASVVETSNQQWLYKLGSFVKCGAGVLVLLIGLGLLAGASELTE